PRHRRPLAGERRHLLDRVVEDLDVRDGVAHAHVERDLLEARHRHLVRDAELLLELGHHLVGVELLQARLIVAPLLARRLRLLALRRLGLLAGALRRLAAAARLLLVVRHGSSSDTPSLVEGGAAVLAEALAAAVLEALPSQPRRLVALRAD